MALTGNETQGANYRNAAADIRNEVPRSKFGKPYTSAFFNNDAARTPGLISCCTGWERLQMRRDTWTAEFEILGLITNYRRDEPG
jgi:hypothetical protein